MTTPPNLYHNLLIFVLVWFLSLVFTCNRVDKVKVDFAVNLTQTIFTEHKSKAIERFRLFIPLLVWFWNVFSNRNRQPFILNVHFLTQAHLYNLSLLERINDMEFCLTLRIADYELVTIFPPEEWNEVRALSRVGQECIIAQTVLYIKFTVELTIMRILVVYYITKLQKGRCWDSEWCLAGGKRDKRNEIQRHHTA